MKASLCIAFSVLILCLSAQSGNLPVIEVLETGGLNFGEQYQGYASQPLTLHIVNSGVANLEIFQFFAGAAWMQVQNPTLPYILAPDDTLALQITIHPTVLGAISDSLYIVNNDPLRKEYPVKVRGVGIPVPLSEVNNLQINVQGFDVQLNWTPVTTNILGGAATPDRYVIYFSEYPSGPYFWPLAVVSSNSFTHARAAAYAPARFYSVKAIRF